MTRILLGLAIGAALWLIISGLNPRERSGPTFIQRLRARARTMAGLDQDATVRRRRQLLIISVGIGALAWLLTGWLILIILVPLAMITLPSILARPPASATLARLTALETWCRGLAGLMASRNALEKAIQASVGSTPVPIRPAVTDLAMRLQAQVPLKRAMKLFADDINDPLGDTIAAAIIVGGERRAHRGGGGTSAALDELARAVAEEVTARTTIEAERSGPRNSVRLITIIALLATAGGFASRQYMEPYSTPVGQGVLLLLGVAFIGCLLWIRRITAGEPPTRLMTPGQGDES